MTATGSSWKWLTRMDAAAGEGKASSTDKVGRPYLIDGGCSKSELNAIGQAGCALCASPELPGGPLPASTRRSELTESITRGAAAADRLDPVALEVSIAAL